jgi:hypothetical protein
MRDEDTIADRQLWSTSGVRTIAADDPRIMPWTGFQTDVAVRPDEFTPNADIQVESADRKERDERVG